MDRVGGNAFDKLEAALKSGQTDKTAEVSISTGNNSPVYYAPNGKIDAFYNTEAAQGDALIPCPHCSRRVSRNAESCPGCGLNVEKHFQQIFHSQQQAKFLKLFILAMLGVIFGIALKVFGYDPVGWLGEVFIFGGMLTAIAGGKLIESGKI